MAKETIRHPAIVAKDPEKLADYYRKVFSIEEVHRDNKAKKPGGKIGVFLTDGYLNPAILPLRLDGENALGKREIIAIFKQAGLRAQPAPSEQTKTPSHQSDVSGWTR